MSKGKRIKVKFTPETEKEVERRTFYRRTHRLVLIAVILLAVFILVHLIEKLGVDLRVFGNDKAETETVVGQSTSGKSTSNNQTGGSSGTGQPAPKDKLFSGHSIPASEKEGGETFDDHFYMIKTGGAPDANNAYGYYGIDVSHWQGNIDWNKVKTVSSPDELGFYIIKATQGSKYLDQDFDQNWKGATALDKGAVGAYHFYVYGDDPVEQANNFIKNVKLKPGMIRPILDIEMDCTKCDSPGVPKDEMVANLKKYISRIENHYGVQPILYTYSSFYETYLKEDFSDYTFWMASYTTTPPLDMNVYSHGEISTNPFIGMWQFTYQGKINGIDGDVDMSFLPVHYLDKVLIN